MPCTPAIPVPLPSLPAPLSVSLPIPTPPIPSIPNICCIQQTLPSLSIPVPIGPLVLNPATVAAARGAFQIIEAYLEARTIPCPRA